MASGTANLPSTVEIPEIPVHRFSVEEYLQLLGAGVLREDAAVELLEGLITPMSPHNPPHNGSVTLTQKALEPILPKGWFIRVQSAIVTADSMPEPDLAVVRGPYRRYLRRHPKAGDIALVVEISEATLASDRQVKGRIYARARIPAYWIVNLAEECIEVFAKPGSASAGTYRERRVYGIDEHVPVVVDGKTVGRVAVCEVL
jgi:Uma2 family endonuclease